MKFKIVSNHWTVAISIGLVTIVLAVVITIKNGGRNFWIYIIVSTTAYLYYDMFSRGYAREIEFLSPEKLKVKAYTKSFKASEAVYSLSDLRFEYKLLSYTRVSRFYILTATDKNGKVAFQMTNRRLMWRMEDLDLVKNIARNFPPSD